MVEKREGKRFGRYVVAGELGRGAMGTVYRAVDPAIEREVAIKTLLPNLPEEVMGEVRERFLREAKSAGRLNHPNIVTIYDVGEQDGVAYIAMELLEGRSLQEILRDPERLPFARIAELAAQVADALDDAARYGIVHRDVKPANVMVSSAGRAKLADFGVAHVASSSMTQTGATLGSPKYMSPEQVLGQPVDQRSDIFSLGAVLYEMLARRTPFERPGDTTVFALMNRIAGELHPEVTALDPSVPAAFNHILGRALAKKPAERYARAGEMAGELRAIGGTGRAQASADAAERTLVLNRPLQAPAAEDKTLVISAPGTRAPAPEQTQLLADLDDFSKNLEAQQQAQLQAEQEERRRKEEELASWARKEAEKRAAFERQREASSSNAQSTAGRSSAIAMLRQRASSRSAGEDRAKKAQLTARIDARLRAAFRYLSEFVVELNAGHPACELPYGLMYLGDVPGAILVEGFTDYRTRALDGKDVVDFVTLKYKVRSPQPRQVDVTGQELPKVRERLDALHIAYECSERKSDFGQVQRAKLTLAGPFPCQCLLRGDYDAQGVVIELINVRRFGARQIRVAVDQFTDELLDEFGTYILGADDGFERLLPRR